jgi:mono/diheme cytochrome c family protein
MKKPKKNKQQAPAAAASASAEGRPAAAAAPARSLSPAAIIRDIGQEPVAKQVAVPALIFAVLGGLLFWGDMHIMGQGGELDARVHFPYESPAQLVGLNVKEPVDPLIEKGTGVYALVCKGCHQEDGQGSAAQGFPPLAGSDWVNVKDPARLIRIVLKGLSGPVTVNGKVYSQAQMLPWESLSDEEIAAVLCYVRNTWGNKNPFVKPADVAKVRAEVKGKTGYWSPDELLAVPLKP